MPEDLLAEGLYTLTVESVDLMHHAIDDDNIYVIELSGADKPCIMYAKNSWASRRRCWGDMAEDWYSLPDTIGRER